MVDHPTTDEGRFGDFGMNETVVRCLHEFKKSFTGPIVVGSPRWASISQLLDKSLELAEGVYHTRESLAQEIREGLRVRGFWAPKEPSDLITAVFQAIEGHVAFVPVTWDKLREGQEVYILREDGAHGPNKVLDPKERKLEEPNGRKFIYRRDDLAVRKVVNVVR